MRKVSVLKKQQENNVGFDAELGNDLSEVISPCSYSSTQYVIFIVVVFNCTI